jgi:hypothetical protein
MNGNFLMRFLAMLLLLPSVLFAAGKDFSVEYEPSTAKGELIFGVTYTVWIPDGVEKLRGAIVHQHGCGDGACKGGKTAAFDLHWQALAKKWDCALLAPYYHQPEKENCRMWCDPRNGSAKTFLRALGDLAKSSNHPELETVPWCLWGHSGGGFWASLMQTMYPDRIVAIWFRSGTAFSSWNKGDIPKPDMPESMYQIPMMCNFGAKEMGDKRFNGAYLGAVEMFKAYRAKNAPIAVAPDPRTGHECGDSRYLAIPFFDACLALRLPEKAGDTLRSIDPNSGWLAPLLGDQATEPRAFHGNSSEAMWLPNEAVAKAWSEYVKTGSVSDTTPPFAPFNVVAKTQTGGGIAVTWDAEADFESGIQQFVIERDGAEIGRLPATPKGKFGRALFQTMSFHDTPEAPLPEMKYVDKTAEGGQMYTYRVITVNGVGLKSKATIAR